MPSVPRWPACGWPVLQSSANLAGGPDPRRLSEIPELIRSAVDLVIDGGELAGHSVDGRRPAGFEETGRWEIVRAGAVPEAALGASRSSWQFHFDPATYTDEIRADVPELRPVPGRAGERERRPARGAILELGTGTGETARRLLARHPGALTGREST